MAVTPVELGEITISEERFPPFDPAHATPDPMLRRLIKVRLDGASAQFEQTDYGHPGRFNDWEPRGIDSRLQPRTAELKALCESLTRLLS